jgi:uncharacterized membrane protein YbhN (UPF0104 family)
MNMTRGSRRSPARSRGLGRSLAGAAGSQRARHGDRAGGRPAVPRGPQPARDDPSAGPAPRGLGHLAGELAPVCSRLTRPAGRRALLLVLFALIAAVALWHFSSTPAVASRLASGRPAWLAVAGGFELISVLGFVAVFQLVFGEWLPKRVVRVGLALRAATIVLPAGGLLAIGAGARALRKNGMPPAKSGPLTIAFLLITNAPNVIVLAGVGLALGAGLTDGPHALILTIVPAVVALSLVCATLLLPRLSHQREAQRSRRFLSRVISAMGAQLELGVIEARALLRNRSWKLCGAVAFYAFDNAVLWAAFRAFGHTHPPIATLVLAYLIGTSAGSLPIPAGLGVIEGGMIGLFVVFGLPALCAGIAVLAYRTVSIALPLALGAAAFVTLGGRAYGESR